MEGTTAAVAGFSPNAVSSLGFSRRVGGLKVAAVDTTGAGDAFVAGILSQLAVDFSLLQNVPVQARIGEYEPPPSPVPNPWEFVPHPGKDKVSDGGNLIVSSSNGSWHSVWILEFSYELQFVEIKGKIQVGAHYFEEGNVHLDTNMDRKDSSILQSPEDTALSITNIIRHHESEYFSSLEEHGEVLDEFFLFTIEWPCINCQRGHINL